MCSETSPRISFSHDLGEEEAVEKKEYRRDTMLLEPNSDFEFMTSSTTFHHESCSAADELFANGVILPVQIQHKKLFQNQKWSPPPTSSSLPPLPRPSSNENLKKETVMVSYENHDQEKPQSKSFWGFKRSSSLNCDAKKSLICALPLLSRSNSTGSAPSKRASLKDSSGSGRQSLQKPVMVKWSSSTSNGHQQRHPLKKSYVGSYGNGVKISPVLNVPPPYISKGTASLFGLGSLLRSGKDKKTNK